MAFFVILLFFNIVLPCLGDHLLHTLTGQVSGGNYSYYSLTYEGPITLSLVTKLGDADLYVSQFLSKPTFDPLAYCLHSATCGADVVHIPKSFRRPIGIGIYGHSSHEVSVYTLDVILRERNGDIGEVVVTDDDDVFENETEFEEPYREPRDSLNADDRRRRKVRVSYPESGDPSARFEEGDEESKEREEPFLWSLMWSLLEVILEMIFL